MAIIIEEEQINKISMITIIGWIGVLVIIVIAVYVIFFQSPESLIEDVPEEFRSTQEISRINLDPEAIINNPNFRSRVQYVDPPVPGGLGRPDPFVPFAAE